MKFECTRISVFDKFKCGAADCPIPCCSNWRIEIDDATYNKTKILSTENSKNRLFAKEILNAIEDFPEGRKGQQRQMKKCENGNCLMFTEDGLCKIHATLGPEYMSTTCTSYPRKIALINRFLEYNLTLSCPDVCRLVLFDKEGLSFTTTVVEGTDINRASIIALEISNVNMHIRNRTILLLKDRSLPLWCRLTLIGLIYKRLDNDVLSDNDLSSADMVFDAFIESSGRTMETFMALPEIQEILDSDMSQILKSAAMMAFSILNNNPALKKAGITKDKDSFLFNPESVSLYDLFHAKQTVFDPYIIKNEHVFENYFISTLFANDFPRKSKSYILNYRDFILSYLTLICSILTLFGTHKTLTDEDIVLGVTLFSKNIQHSKSMKSFIDKFDVAFPNIMLAQLVCLFKY